MGNSKIIKTILKAGLVFVLVGGFTIYAGYFFEAWTGFPKGVDLYARTTRVKFILDFFPHVNWQYHWANGLPTFTTEGPFFYYLAAVLVKLTSISIETSMIILGMVTFFFLGLGVWGFIYNLTKSIAGGLVASFLVLSSFSTWSWLVQGGIYPRIFSVGLMALSFWFFAVYCQKEKTEKSSRYLYAVLILTLTALLTSHILIGLFTFAALTLYLVFLPLSLGQKFHTALKVFGGSLALSAFFYSPFLAAIPNSSNRFLGVISPVMPMDLASLWDFPGLGPIILPLFGLLMLLNFKAKVIRSSLIMLLFFVFYGFIGHTGLSGKYYYINGFIPYSAVLFLCLFASIISGLLLAEWLKSEQRGKRVIGIILAAVVFLGAIIVVPLNARNQKEGQLKHNRPFVYDSSASRSWTRITQEMGTFPDNEFQHRFAPFDALEAAWFNYVYKTPQERDYYGQGILHPDWRYWFEQALWNPEFKEAETKMALDWFAIRWFTEAVPNLGPVRPIEEVLAQYPSRYLDNPDYQFIQSGFIDWNMLLRFEKLDPSSILSVTNATPVLVIGKEDGYNVIFRDLSLLNINSQKMILLLGKKYIDDYKLNELTEFKLIVLYNYQYRQKEKAYQLLEKYVKQGGHLIWETAGSLDVEGSLPEPAPMSQLKKEEVKKAWNFGGFFPELTNGIDLTSFSALTYNQDVWRISWAAGTDLRPQAKGILGKDGQWIAIGRDYGLGKIVWTGFNFPYHLSMEKNNQEAQFLRKMLTWLGVGEEQEKVNFKAEFVNPEKRMIEISEPAQGVLFKENFYPKWQARLEKGGKQTIYYAGPGMMYVLLPVEKNTEPKKLIFEYKPTGVEILGILISVMALLSLIFYLIFGRLPLSFPFSRKMAGWWEKDE